MLKSLLVYLDATTGATAPLDVALELAQAHDAHVTGLSALPPFDAPVFAAAQFPAEIVEQINGQRHERLAEMEQAFSAKIAAAGWGGRSQWTSSDMHPADAIVDIGRTTDLVIMGQSQPGETDPQRMAVPDEVVVELGRPMLVVPYVRRPATLAKRILVAWNNTREGARAVNDAIPLLRGADDIEILTVNPEAEETVPGADIADYLARHGLKVTVNRSMGDGIAVADALLNRASDGGFDLLVMGAYGHSRMREVVLGGATRGILEHMTVPVLMSH